MTTRSKLLACALLALLSTATLHASLLSEALLLFPGDTQSIEYDNLAELKKVPDYQSLRQQYTAIGLQQALRSFRKLGIKEDTVEEVVLGSDPTGSFGIASGVFSGAGVTKLGWNSLTNVVFQNEHILCPQGPACLWFFADSIAAFGNQDQLRRLIETRDGGLTRITQNSALTGLLPQSETITAPVIGAGPGSKVLAWMGTSLPSSALSALGLNQLLSGIQWFSYAIDFPLSTQPSTAHAKLQLLCSSDASAAALSQVLTAYSAMQKQFDHASISSSGSTVAFEADFLDRTQ